MDATVVELRHGRKCGAEARSGQPCKRPAGWGTGHPGYGRCKNHTGSTPNGEKSAQREMAADAARAYGLPRDVDPQTALREELHRTAGLVSFYGDRCAQLDEEKLHGPVGGSLFGIPREEAHIWVRLHQQEREHFTRVAKTCIECGIAEREIRLAEAQGELLAKVIQGVLDELGIADNPEVPGVVRRHLTAVAS